MRKAAETQEAGTIEESSGRRTPAAVDVGPRRQAIGSWAYWGGLALFILVALELGVHFTWKNLRIPLASQGDALHFLAIARAILDSGWWWHISRLGAPFGSDMVAFPACGLLDSAIFFLISIVVKDPALLVNTFWVTSFVLTGFSAAWSLRVLKISPPVAGAVGILYAFLPNAFARNIGHLMLVLYFIPVTAAAAILVARDGFATLDRRERGVFYLGFACIGLDYVYHAFFACFLLAVAGAIAWSSRRRAARPALVGVGIIAACAFVSLAPTLLAWRHDPDANANVDVKVVAEADIYGLKLRHLLLPIPNHPFPPFREIERTFAEAGFPLENENSLERLGTCGSFGFLVLLGASLLRTSGAGDGLSSSLAAPAALNLAALLLATIGGFGSMFNALVSPGIRAYNRISTFIAFFALYATAVLLDHCRVKLSTAGLPRWSAYAVAGLLASAGVADQMIYQWLRASHQVAASDYASVRPLVAEVEKRIPGGAMIFQLPVSPYPNAPSIQGMTPHQHLLPFVVSKKLRWSHAGLSRAALEFGERMEGDSPHDLVRDLTLAGFEGIWIDNSGYSDQGKGVRAQLTAEGANGPLASADGRFVFLSLASCRRRLLDEIGAERFAALRSALNRGRTLGRMTGPLAPGAFRAMLELILPGGPFKARATRPVEVRIRNVGTGMLSSRGAPDGRFAVYLAYRWMTPTHEVKVEYGTRIRLPRSLGSGEEVTLTPQVKSPDAAGEYLLEVDLVQEGVAWFEDRGSTPAIAAVPVQD